MAVLSKEKLEKLTTKRLLAYKNSLLRYHNTSDWDQETFSKESLEWQETYKIVKEILSAREHVER